MPETRENEAVDSANSEEDLTKDNSVKSSIRDELKSKLGIKDAGHNDNVPKPPPPPHLNEEGLIIPRKLSNPVLDSAERQRLHKEMIFNQKTGKDVLNQKSELEKALAKHKDNIAKRELQNNLAKKTPEFKKLIDDRARKLEMISLASQEHKDDGLNTEFVQARAKLKNRSDST